MSTDPLETKNLLESGSPILGVYPEDHAKSLDALLNESVLKAAAGGLFECHLEVVRLGGLTGKALDVIG